MTADASGQDFLWGAATSAYQIEGAVAEDGRGESIWDRFCALPRKIRNGESGAIACDSYHRYREDVALLRELGANAYRFSVAWPRVLPAGTGGVNEAGLDYYERLVDELLDAGVTPVVTLYHWDLPSALEDQGGWPVRRTAEAFARYAEVVAKRLGDRVRYWITQNEPRITSWLGYGTGIHAPGRRSLDDRLAALHHLFLSHGLAAEVLRREVSRAQVSIALDLWPAVPAGDDPDDAEAAAEADGEENRLYLDPVFRGEYPTDVLERLGRTRLPIRDGDMQTISAPLDFLGVNFYSRHLVERTADGGRRAVRPPDAPRTGLGWEIAPDALHDLLLRIHRDYFAGPIAITENGAAFTDARTHEGEVEDPERREYLSAHVEAIGRAAAEGVPVCGYFVWSLLDNFEWTFGYSARFGLVYVDYPTLERVPKSSFCWYRDLIAAST